MHSTKNSPLLLRAMSAWLIAIVAAFAPGVAVAQPTPSDTVTFSAFGEVASDSDGYISPQSLEALGILATDIDRMMTGMATSTGDPGTSTLEPQGTGIYQILSNWSDYRGRKVQVRLGYWNPSLDRGWGYAKYTGKHNLTTRAVRAATAHTPNWEDQATATVYFQTVLKYQCSGWGPWRKCKVVDRTTVRTVHDRTILNDGSPKGVITSYCIGYSGRCPDWVKNAANI